MLLAPMHDRILRRVGTQLRNLVETDQMRYREPHTVDLPETSLQQVREGPNRVNMSPNSLATLEGPTPMQIP